MESRFHDIRGGCDGSLRQCVLPEAVRSIRKAGDGSRERKIRRTRESKFGVYFSVLLNRGQVRVDSEKKYVSPDNPIDQKKWNRRKYLRKKAELVRSHSIIASS